MKTRSAVGQTGKAPSSTLSTSAHADYERDQGRVSPCYPDERCFLPSIGVELQNRLFLGMFSTKQSCACMLGWGPW